MAGFRLRVRANGQAKFLSGLFYLRVKRGALGAADFYFFGIADGGDARRNSNPRLLFRRELRNACRGIRSRAGLVLRAVTAANKIDRGGPDLTGLIGTRRAPVPAGCRSRWRCRPRRCKCCRLSRWCRCPGDRSARCTSRFRRDDGDRCPEAWRERFWN